MDNSGKTMLLWSLMVLISLGCTQEEVSKDECASSNTVNVRLISSGESSEGAIENSCTIGHDENSQYIIQTEKQYKALINCNTSLPEINFTAHTLLIGKDQLPWCCSEVISQWVYKKCQQNEYVYEVRLSEPEGKYAAFSTFYYWTLIPKISTNQQIIFDVQFIKP